VEAVTATGPILGALPDWGGTTAALKMGAGDLLLLYTDGISEARRGKGADFFGYEGVARALSEAAAPLGLLERVAETVVGAAKAFAGFESGSGGASGGSLGDDVCLLLARRRG